VLKGEKNIYIDIYRPKNVLTKCLPALMQCTPQTKAYLNHRAYSEAALQFAKTYESLENSDWSPLVSAFVLWYYLLKFKFN
jgi:hypothetical protein